MIVKASLQNESLPIRPPNTGEILLAHQCPIYKSKPSELSQNVKNILNMISQRQVEPILYAVHCCGYWLWGVGSYEEGGVLFRIGALSNPRVEN